MSVMLHKSIMKNLKNESAEMHECSLGLCKISQNHIRASESSLHDEWKIYSWLLFAQKLFFKTIDDAKVLITLLTLIDVWLKTNMISRDTPIIDSIKVVCLTLKLITLQVHSKELQSSVSQFFIPHCEILSAAHCIILCGEKICTLPVAV